MKLWKYIVKFSPYRQFVAPILSLFTSLSTLICCAIPAILVLLGMGATLASFISSFPLLITISKFKIQLFLIAGILLVIASYFFWQFKNAPCPIDIKQAKLCEKLKGINFKIIIFSFLIYLVGFFFSFLADDFFY